MTRQVRRAILAARTILAASLLGMLVLGGWILESGWLGFLVAWGLFASGVFSAFMAISLGEDHGGSDEVGRH